MSIQEGSPRPIAQRSSFDISPEAKGLAMLGAVVAGSNFGPFGAIAGTLGGGLAGELLHRRRARSSQNRQTPKK